jgi:hypothetical protein
MNERVPDSIDNAFNVQKDVFKNLAERIYTKIQTWKANRPPGFRLTEDINDATTVHNELENYIFEADELYAQDDSTAHRQSVVDQLTNGQGSKDLKAKAMRIINLPDV